MPDGKSLSLRRATKRPGCRGEAASTAPAGHDRIAAQRGVTFDELEAAGISWVQLEQSGISWDELEKLTLAALKARLGEAVAPPATPPKPAHHRTWAEAEATGESWAEAEARGERWGDDGPIEATAPSGGVGK